VRWLVFRKMKREGVVNEMDIGDQCLQVVYFLDSGASMR